MANTFTPVFIGTFSGHIIYQNTDLVVSDTFKNYVESLEVSHRNKFLHKQTGFETVKHTIDAVSGSDVLVDIQITLVGSLPRWLQNKLLALAKACNGAGMKLTFLDNWADNISYSCRWVNAGDFVQNSPIFCGASMMLQAWELTEV